MFRTLWVHPQQDSCKGTFLYGMLTYIGVISPNTLFHLLDCLHQWMKTHRKKIALTAVFLMMNTWGSKHEGDVKS